MTEGRFNKRLQRIFKQTQLVAYRENPAEKTVYFTICLSSTATAQDQFLSQRHIAMGRIELDESKTAKLDSSTYRKIEALLGTTDWSQSFRSSTVLAGLIYSTYIDFEFCNVRFL